MAGRKSRDKGARREREFAELIGGEKVPLSGALGGKYHGDVIGPHGERWQVKSQAAGWKSLYAELADHDVLAVKADRQPWLVVMTLDRYKELLGKGA